jgi:hypothetical protein
MAATKAVLLHSLLAAVIISVTAFTIVWAYTCF